MKKMLLLTSCLAATGVGFAAEVNTDLLKKSLNPTAKIKQVKASAIPGLYEVQVNDQIIYLSADGEKVITGDIYDLKKKISYTEQSKTQLRTAALAAVKDSDKIIYKAKNEQHKITVFTDITCGYCIKLHKEIEDFNDAGITVEYLAFPRAGVGSSAQKNMQNIWCAENKTQALTAAKLKKQIPPKSCEGKQTIEQFFLGQEMGVNATPTMIFSDGEIMPGYVSADELAAYLKEKSAAN